MTEKIIVYGHAGCPMVPPVIGMLKLSRVNYRFINIHRDSDSAARVRDINHGNETVPTLLFPDSSILTEPSEEMLRTKLEAMGYTVPLTGRLAMNMWLVIIVLGVLLALVRLLHLL